MTRTVPLAFSLALWAAALPAAAQTHAGAGMNPRVGFGTTVAIAGDELLIGRPGELVFFPSPPNHPGSVHVFARQGNTWTERGRIEAAGTEIGDGFALEMAASGSTLLVGAPHEAEGRGAAYVFVRAPSGTWQQTARLADPAALPGDAFGAAVAVNGDLALVGVPGRADGTGAVAVFRRTGDAWTRAGSLDASGVSTADGFGRAVAFDGTRAIVGAPGPIPVLGMFGTLPPRPGRVFVYALQPDGTSRREAALDFGGTIPASLGARVLVAGDQAFAAAPLAAQGAGVIVRFTRDAAGTWRQAQQLGPSPQAPSGTFGTGLALAGNDLLAGSPQENGTGAVHVFRQAGSADWTHAQTLGGPAPFSGFGATVASAGADAWIGMPGADFFEGSVVQYRRGANGEWTRVAALVTDMTPLEAITGGEVTCQDRKAAAFDCVSVDLVAFLPVSAVGGTRGNIVNDLWGWTDPVTGREIAIVGRNDATTFIDVTNATNPVYLGELPLHAGATPNIWRDIKVYADHAFIVADGAGAHGMQVFDLRQLRDVRNPPARFTETAHYDRIHSAHNIVINEGVGYAYIVGASMGGETCGGGLHIVDIRTPAAPTFVGCFADTRTGLARTGYSHDAQCITYRGPDARYQGREICFGSNESMLSVSDVTDRTRPLPIAAVGYPNSAYLHQGWVSDDHRFIYMNDEGDEVAGTVPRTRTLVWDISELDDPILVTEYLGETAASDHNLYVKGNYVYESNYVSGLRILDITDRTNPVEVGFFDTVPFGPDKPGFAGSWSNYPYFASGNIIVTSMREGVFILRQRPPRPIS